MIQDKQDLDAILRQDMCTCAFHNLLINHPVLPDWFDETIEELDHDDELNQSVEQSGGDTRRNRVFAYMLEESFIGNKLSMSSCDTPSFNSCRC